MNLGLSDYLKSEFSDFSPIERPIITTNSISDPNWISGFVSGEGNFDVRIAQKASNKIGYRVQLRFRVSQDVRNIILIENIAKFLGTGNVYKYPKQDAVVLTIFKYSDLTNIIIPFFEKYPILGIKQLDFLDWCRVSKLMIEGSHLTVEGLELIQAIKS